MAQTIKTTALTTELPLQQNITHSFWTESDELQATTPFAFDFYQHISSLNWLKKGLHLAQQFKKSWAPAYDVVYSLDLKWDLPVLDVEHEQALQILHGESQTLSAEAGHYFVRFQGQNIAMIKQLGQRFNNLHPTEWRIRHLPKK
jgi:NOL1/NOP2/fmu family ribosome biogenesis protein